MEPLRVELVPLLEEARKLASFCHVRIQGEDSSLQPGRGLSPELNPAGILISDFQTLSEINFCS